jgi:hypothetical protein
MEAEQKMEQIIAMLAKTDTNMESMQKRMDANQAMMMKLNNNISLYSLYLKTQKDSTFIHR